MSKIAWIAWRDFLATVSTKGFIFGLLVTPAIMGVMIVVMPRLLNEKPPNIKGEIAVLDPTREVAEGVHRYLTPEAIARRRIEESKKIQEELPESVRTMMERTGRLDPTDEALQAALGGLPRIRVDVLPAGTDLEPEKQRLLETSEEGGDRLALVVVHPDSVRKAPGQDSFGSYDLFVREKLDDRIEDEIKAALRRSIVDARVKNAGLDRDVIESVMHVERMRSTTVTKGGERETNEIFNILLPMAFMILLFIAVISGGQQLLTSTIEEKSSRVVEVLLSAVSPMQLMTGKILGQLGAGLVILAIYVGLGLAALVSFAFLGLVDFSLLFYLVVFYFIAYFTLGSFMAAIGAAVNQLSEAQPLMMPVMLCMTIPLMLWVPISRDPNSVFALIASFVPPINSFVILIRMASAPPPPIWQVWLAILAGLGGVYASVWAASKVFRIGLLMHGKPPNLATLIRWIRMA